MPRLFPVIEGRRHIRKCVVTKQISLYYMLTRKEIVIITLFDQRQSPKKLKRLL